MKRKKTIEPVPYVEIDRYAGVWYEIGRYQHWYEKGATNVSAEYIQKDGYLEVFNRYKKTNKDGEIKGKAFIVPNSGNAKLKVQFHWPFKGDYWVIDLDEDYQWAVVSNSSRSNLWILYRKPIIDNEELRPIVYRLVNNGFELAKVHWTKQTNEIKE